MISGDFSGPDALTGRKGASYTHRRSRATARGQAGVSYGYRCRHGGTVSARHPAAPHLRRFQHMFGSIGMPELIIILVIALIIFGPRKLPELGKSLGRSLNEFKRASQDLQNTLEQEIKLEEQKEQQAKTRAEPRRGRARRGRAYTELTDTGFRAPTSRTVSARLTLTMALVPFPGATRARARYRRRHAVHRQQPASGAALGAPRRPGRSG